ncbi:NYN domain-containing protein [Streptosporangium sp. G11]|uniref:NYN domain-containing protein n=1 Tax=Streptosporangium sp. G11 TaxID=3436926 RepID=UPI003EBCD105
MVSDTLAACVLIDYQNIHLTAWDLYPPHGVPVKEALIDPLAFAERVLQVRAARQQPHQKTLTLAKVCVYRGAPSNAKEPVLYSVSQRQRAAWTRDARVCVTYRTLRYPSDWGKPSRFDRPREKGIDVMIALELVQQAQSGPYNVVILASHDTDMEPALEMAARVGRVKVETAGWDGSRRLKIPGRNLWHTTLSARDFVLVKDRRNYG